MAVLSAENLQILLVSGSLSAADIRQEMLAPVRGREIQVTQASSFSLARELLQSPIFHAVLIDLDLGAAAGIDLIRETTARGCPAPLIVYRSQAGHKDDLDAMEAGAVLCLVRSEVQPHTLGRLILLAIERKKNEVERSIILGSNQDGFLGIDWNWRFTYLNQRAAANLGYKPEDLTGKNIWEVFPKLLGTPQEEHYRRVMTERTPGRFELPGVYNGLWYSVSIYPSSEGISMYWQDITERKRAEESLRALEIEQIENATRIELQRRLLEFREQERQQIARDLHDGPVQDIYALILYIESVMDLFKSPEAKAAARKLIGHLQHTGQNLRNMIKDMRPPSLVRFGLARALQDYFEEFKEKHPQVVLDTSMVDDGICLSEQARMHLFRVCQEALSNVVRHARATRVTVQLDCKDDSLSLQIRDNGCGFAVSNNLFEYSHRGHFGLVGMRERIDTIGGTFEILSNTGNGTHISITVPLQK